MNVFINITRDYIERAISAECRAQMKKSVTYHVSAYVVKGVNTKNK